MEVSRAGSDQPVVKGEWVMIDNSKTVVEDEISSELKAFTHYVATLLYKTTFSNFTTSLQFSKCELSITLEPQLMNGVGNSMSQFG